jgi:hypothetical protein
MTCTIQDLFKIIEECKQEERDAETSFQKIIETHASKLQNGLENMEEMKYQILSTQQRAHTLATCITSSYELADSVSSKVYFFSRGLTIYQRLDNYIKCNRAYKKHWIQ